MVKENQPNESQSQEQDKTAHNLRFYSQACEVPADAQKKINAGRIRGMTDVNPMWRMKKMTELFGPCGIGWKYVIERQWSETYGQEVKCFCNVLLYVRDPETGQWSEPIPGNGGSSLVSIEKNGPYVNDEGYKMALTDALSIAMKPLGIGANIWYGPKATGHNESKYEAATAQPQQSSSVGYTDAQLQQALSELNTAHSRADYEAVWRKWQTQCPAICQKGTEFYNTCIRKAQEIQQ